MKDWANISESYLHHLVLLEKCDGVFIRGFIADSQKGIVYFFKEEDKDRVNSGDKSIIQEIPIPEIKNIQFIPEDD